MTAQTRDLRTIKKASEITGASQRFIQQLIQEGQLTRYKINTATYISLVEFDSIAKPVKKPNYSHDRPDDTAS